MFLSLNIITKGHQTQQHYVGEQTYTAQQHHDVKEKPNIQKFTPQKWGELYYPVCKSIITGRTS